MGCEFHSPKRRMSKNVVRTNDEYAIVLGARSENRLTTTDYINALIDEFTELVQSRYPACDLYLGFSKKNAEAINELKK